MVMRGDQDVANFFWGVPILFFISKHHVKHSFIFIKFGCGLPADSHFDYRLCIGGGDSVFCHLGVVKLNSQFR
ncbi:hypothetical protein SDC9_176653 [bioreactor metagenome]|uniref:Uncharacterized protein n=1 Tax=bioreactor metagenome TaxID=1076179 RepID=A0A645GTB9_9ZZZZ